MKTVSTKKNKDDPPGLIDIIKEHIATITCLTLFCFLKFKIIESTLFLIICVLSGCVAIFELMGSRFKILASIGWIFVIIWLIFGEIGILKGY